MASHKEEWVKDNLELVIETLQHLEDNLDKTSPYYHRKLAEGLLNTLYDIGTKPTYSILERILRV